jgi:hypothetical protein
MTSFSIFLGLVISSSMAVMYSTPRQLSALREAGIVFPAPRSAAVIQGIALSAIAAGFGVVLNRLTTFSLLSPADFSIPTLAATGIGVLGHLLLYYLLFRPRIPQHTILLAERIRLNMGLPARVLQGGIVEEVQFRWGLMSLAASITIPLFPSQSAYPVPVAIVVSALLFALFHLVGARQIGLAKNSSEVVLIMADNVWGGIVFGWLFWQYGLATAMVSHALFHVAWFPIERWVYRRDTGMRESA